MLIHAEARNSGGTEPAVDVARFSRAECICPGESRKHCCWSGRNVGGVGILFSGNEGTFMFYSIVSR